MNYLLDTCVLSEFLRKKSDERVLDWVNSQHEESLYVSVLAIGEIQKGIAKLVASKRKSELELWLDVVVRRYGSRILPFTATAANLWGKMKAQLEAKGRILPVIDSLMAASALEHGLTIVTRNEEDFEPTGVKVLNLWQ